MAVSREANTGSRREKPLKQQDGWHYYIMVYKKHHHPCIGSSTVLSASSRHGLYTCNSAFLGGFVSSVYNDGNWGGRQGVPSSIRVAKDTCHHGWEGGQGPPSESGGGDMGATPMPLPCSATPVLLLLCMEKESNSLHSKHDTILL